MKFIFYILTVFLLSSCWPKSISFVDGTMPEDWKMFIVNPIKNNAPNAPINYSPNLAEAIKDGIQNGTRLKLATSADEAQIEIEGTVVNYSISPIALQEGDNASQNRLSVSVKFDIFINAAEEDEMHLVSTRFFDYNSSTDIGTVESQFLEEITTQVVQDVINKLLSNW